MHPFKIVSVTCYAVCLITGVLLFRGGFTQKLRARPRWVRVAFWVSGVVAVLWGTLGMTIAFGHLSPPIHYLFRLYNTFLAGMGTGILLLLVLSGELVRLGSAAEANDTTQSRSA